MSKNPNKPSMYIVHVSTNPPPTSAPNANMDRRLYPQIVTHKKFKLNIFPKNFRDLNKDPSVHGIIVQMPLDSEQEVKTRFGNDLKKTTMMCLDVFDNFTLAKSQHDPHRLHHP